MSKPKEYSSMTKDKLMTYTFLSVLILTIVTAAIWSTETSPSGWNLGLTVAICALISVGIAVGLDAFLHKVAVDSPLNLMSAAVFGLIVTDCYTLGVPVMRTVELFPLEAPQCFAFVAAMSVVGLVVFKKLVGVSGRKYVNPAAAAKFVVMIPFIDTLLIAVDHLKSSATWCAFIGGSNRLSKSSKSQWSVWIWCIYDQLLLKRQSCGPRCNEQQLAYGHVS